MAPQIHDVASRIGGYVTKWRDANVYSVGTGLYGLVAVYEDGGRSLAITGFDSASDAALFAPYAHKVTGIARPRHLMQTPFGPRDADPDVPHSNRLRYEIVMISSALPSDAFDQLLSVGPR
jgi:hypothetical protein